MPVGSPPRNNLRPWPIRLAGRFFIYPNPCSNRHLRGGEPTNPTACPHGHEIHSAADRDADGWCKRCRKTKNVSYRSRQRAALELALALESHGVAVTRSEPPVDLQQLAAALARGYPSG